MIDPAYQRRGIAEEAVLLALDIAFSETDVNRIWAGVLSNNEPAIRLCRRVGLVEEGRAREVRFEDGQWLDHIYFSVLEREWRRRTDLRSAPPRGRV